MNLAIIADSSFKIFFDEVISKNGYFIVKIGDEQCVLLEDNNLEIVKSVGISNIVDFTDCELDKEKTAYAKEQGLIYSHISISGDADYIRPLIRIIIGFYGSKGNMELTERELDVLKLVGIGMTNKEIAKKLFLSEKTVKNHLNNIFKKIEVSDRTNAAIYAVKHNIF